MPAMSVKNMSTPGAALDLGLGMGGGSVLQQQMKDETDEIKQRRQMNARLTTMAANGGASQDLDLPTLEELNGKT